MRDRETDMYTLATEYKPNNDADDDNTDYVIPPSPTSPSAFVLCPDIQLQSSTITVHHSHYSDLSEKWTML